MVIGELVVDTIAAVRLARLIRDDGITQPARDLVTAAAGSNNNGIARAGGWGRALLACPWCLTVWTAGAVVVARGVAPRWGPRLVAGLAAAELAGRIRAAEEG